MIDIIRTNCFNLKTRNIALIFISLMFLSMFLGCAKEDLKKEDFKTEYQGVLLVGGLGYYGKIVKCGTNFIEMTDVYYVQSRQNPETKQVDSIIIKRGKEWHGPDRMYLNMSQVVMIEPVTPDSELAKKIQQFQHNISK